MNAIEMNNLTHSYEFDGRLYRSLENVNLTVRQGEFLAVLGHNGCGKTTLARHLNALLPVQEGELTVAGLDAKNTANVWKIRKSCGMVFQNPDNQFVSSLAEEDIAFGPRNFGVPEEEIPKLVKECLRRVGLEGFEKRSPHSLSGGQKQRLAIAGVLAAKPDILVLDEVTSMLDPAGRCEVMDTVNSLHREGKTIVLISHYIEEATAADRIMLIHAGNVLAEGTPQEILTNPELLKQAGLTPPMPVRAYYDLKKAGIDLKKCPLTAEELAEALCHYC